MRHLIHILTGCVLLASFPALPQAGDQENVQTVRDFIAAFNSHDSGAMSRFVADDVQWLSVTGDSISVETNDKAALVSAMNAYFESCPTCRSRLTATIATRDRVSAIEVASWQGNDGPETQSAIAVYEFSGGLIKRVHYFPAEKRGDGSAPWSSAAQSPVRCDEAPARSFDFWLGDWNIRQQILREDGTYLELPAKTSVSAALDGCALIENWEGQVQFFWEGMEKPEMINAISVRAYEPRTGKWHIHWMDTRSRSFDAPYVGGFADDRGVFYREWRTPEGKRIGRIVFSDLSRDSVNWSLAVSSDGRQSWTTLWTMEMRRAGQTGSADTR